MSCPKRCRNSMKPMEAQHKDYLVKVVIDEVTSRGSIIKSPIRKYQAWQDSNPACGGCCISPLPCILVTTWHRVSRTKFLQLSVYTSDFYGCYFSLTLRRLRKHKYRQDFANYRPCIRVGKLNYATKRQSPITVTPKGQIIPLYRFKVSGRIGGRYLIAFT